MNALQRPEEVCAGFCAYYKPGKKEAGACRGAIIVQRLLQRGRARVLPRRRLVLQEDVPAVAAWLSDLVCPACDFRIDGCDFAADGISVPCGGLLCLDQLIAEGAIGAADLESA